MDRATALKRLRATVAEGKPVIGAGAGTGLSAKSAEAGGVDLIIIYNSGRYRMAGRGSLSGLLAYGCSTACSGRTSKRPEWGTRSRSTWCAWPPSATC